MHALRQTRRQKGWSQHELAERSGVGQDTISAIESGRHEPRPSTLRKLAAALDTEVANFFQEPDRPKAEVASPSNESPQWNLTSLGVWRGLLSVFNKDALKHLDRLPEKPSLEEWQAEREWVKEKLLVGWGAVDQMAKADIYNLMVSYVNAVAHGRSVPHDVQQEAFGLNSEFILLTGTVLPRVRNWFDQFAEEEDSENLNVEVAKWRPAAPRNST